MSTTVFKAFATHDSFIKNAPGVLNPIGELSTYAQTYRREKGIYTLTSVPDITLYGFTSEVDGTQVELDSGIKDRCFTILSWLYSKVISTSGELVASDILADLLTTYGTIANTFNSGGIVTDGDHYIPEWLSWIDTTTNADVKIWFAEASFLKKYEDYEILVCGPIDNLDYFFRPGSDVEQLLAKTTLVETMGRITTLRGRYPETYLTPINFDYTDPNNPNRVLTTTWWVLVYGEAGNNVDSIKDALAKHILSHSSYAKSDWMQILPDIFKRTEFIVIPDWASLAIPEKVNSVGIYSPMMALVNAPKLLATYAPSYPAAHTAAYAEILAHQYQSLTLVTIGSPENKGNKYQLSDYFADYIAVSTSSLDFNRMSEFTRGWAEMLYNLILTAESMTEYSDLMDGQTRLKRDGLLYVVGTYDNIHYLVLSKKSRLEVALVS